MRSTLGVRVLVTLGAAVVAACSETPLPVEQPPPTTGAVKGTVTLADQPGAAEVSGTVVTLGTALQVTNAAGGFAFENVPAGEVKIRASRDGYAAQEKTVAVVAGETATLDIAMAPPEVPNGKPSISSFSVDPQQLKPGAAGTALVVASDPDGDPLTYTWTAENGFEVEAAEEEGRAVVTAPVALEVKGVLTVVVDDGKGGTATAKLELSTSSNNLPLLTSVTATPSSVEPGGTIELSAVAKDVESGGLSYAWEAPSGWTVTGSGATVSLTAPDVYGQSALIKLVVSDEHGGTANGQISVATIPNAKPVITSLTATPNQVAPNGTIALDVSAYDPHGDALTYAWTAPAGWTVVGTGESVTLTAPGQYGQIGTATVTVEDGHGGTVQANVVVSTAANKAPVLTSITATPPTVQKGGAIQLSASASDPDGDPLTFTWTAPTGWTLTANGPTAQVVAPTAPGQVGVVTLEVTDSEGAKVTGSVAVSTASNNGPVVSSITASPSVVAKGGTTTLGVTASDPDGDPLTYAWTVPAGWTSSGPLTTATLNVTAPGTPGVMGSAQVVVTDSSGASATASVVISTQANAAPAVSSLTANPSSVQKGGTIQLQASASDADGDPLSYAWSVPAGWTLSGAGAQVTLTAPGQPGQSGTVTVTVTDGFGGSTSSSVVVSTLANQKPVVSSVTANPPSVQKGGTIQLNVSASDADGDALSYAWSAPAGWTLSGTSTAAVTLTAHSQPGQSATVSVTVTDGFGGTTTSAVVVSTMPNGNPQVSALAATPNPVFRGGTMTVSASASDPDGDPLAYAWTVSNGAWTLSGTGSSVSLQAPNQYAALATVTLTVSDAFGGSVDATLPVSTSSNQSPTVHSVSVGPMPILPGESTTAVASATDPDGDPLTYAWSVNQPGWTVAGTGAQVTVTAAFQNAQTATLTVAATDGFGGTASGSTVLTTSSCPANRMNCDGDAVNGCEANLLRATSCGACGVVCGGATPFCSAGTCVNVPVSFRVDSLGITGCSSIEHNFVTGDDRGGIAISTSHVFYSGDSQTGRFSAVDLSGGAGIGTVRDTFTGNLFDETVYLLGAGPGAPLGYGGGTVTHLLELDGTTGALTGDAIALDTPISATGFTGVFAGWNSVVIWNGSGEIFEIELPSGAVVSHGTRAKPGLNGCESWAFWGVAEKFDGNLHLVFVQSFTAIARFNVATGTTATFQTYSSLSDMCSFTYSPSRSRWYWHHEGASQFRSGDEAIGFCDASHSHP